MLTLTRNLFVFVIAIFILSLAVAPIYAQDTGSSSTSIVLPTGSPSPELAATAIISAIYTLIAQPFLAPLVTLLVSLSKRAKWLKNVRPETLNFAWSGALFILWMIAAKFGFGAQFESGVSVLIGLGTYALGQTITPMAASAVYKQAKSQNVAVLGYRRDTASDIANAVYGRPDNPVFIAEATPDAIPQG